MTAATWVLAHQGGWDELLLVAAPVGLLVLLLRIANARAAAQERAADVAVGAHGHDERPGEPLDGP